MNEKQIALVFKALADENRIKIINLLQTGEKCACKLLEEIKVSQPTLSYHMKILSDAELVKVRKDGKWMYYRISSEMLEDMIDVLLKMKEVEMKSCCMK